MKVSKSSRMCKSALSFWRVRWEVVVALLALLGGCKREEPVPAATPSSSIAPHPGAAPPLAEKPVPPEETFVLSDVTFRYDEKDSRLQASYRVTSRSAKRERLAFCIDLIDKDGFFVIQGRWTGQFSLRSKGSDEMVDESARISPDVWEASEVVLFYMGVDYCRKGSLDARSNVVALAKSGLPPPPGAQVKGRESPVDVEDVPAPWFRLEDVRVRQDNGGVVWADYRLTNLTKGRATSELCVRLVNDSSCSCQYIDQAESEEFNLGLGASERLSTVLDLSDNQNWDGGRYLIIYTSRFGCIGSPEDASSNVVILAKPRSIEAPEVFDEGE